eukprot:15350407-Ditylum_brightwellii.AAC.1
MEDHQAWTNAVCPQKCGEKMEDPEHIITCRKANSLWRELQSILLSWGAKNAAAPGLMASIVHGLHTWRDGETISPPQGISTACADTFHEKTCIGWSTASKGFLSNKWQIIWTEYYKIIGSAQSGQHFISELIQKMFDVSWDFWQHRNYLL